MIEYIIQILSGNLHQSKVISMPYCVIICETNMVEDQQLPITENKDISYY